MPVIELPRPWRWDPGQTFNAIATHVRVAAGFPIGAYGPSEAEFLEEPELIRRDLALVLAMGIRQARRAGVELDFDALIAAARAEAEQWERSK